MGELRLPKLWAILSDSSPVTTEVEEHHLSNRKDLQEETEITEKERLTHD